MYWNILTFCLQKKLHMCFYQSCGNAHMFLYFVWNDSIACNMQHVNLKQKTLWVKNFLNICPRALGCFFLLRVRLQLICLPLFILWVIGWCVFFLVVIELYRHNFQHCKLCTICISVWAFRVESKRPSQILSFWTFKKIWMISASLSYPTCMQIPRGLGHVEVLSFAHSRSIVFILLIDNDDYIKKKINCVWFSFSSDFLCLKAESSINQTIK